MKSSLRIPLLLILFICSCTSCAFLNKTRIKSEINFSKRNIQLIQECSKFAIEFTIENSNNSFSTSQVSDKAMRKKIASLGASVTVEYKNTNYEIPDSIVTFKTMSLFYGVHEIIYDFAYNQRKFEKKGSPKETYYFVQISDRVYLRRRELPLM